MFVSTSADQGLELVLATDPHPKDRAGRTWLELDPTRCREETLAANDQAKRLIGYWHTHPQTIPNMSSQDVASFRAFAQSNMDVLPYPVAVIVGNGSEPDAMRAWNIRPEGILAATLVLDGNAG